MATTSNTDEIKAITEQRLELSNAQTLESDLDFAFQLQLEEAFTASLSLLPSSSSPSSSHQPTSSCNNGDEFNFVDLQSKELEKLEQEQKDREFSEIEAKKLRDDLNRRIHDQKLAVDIVQLPEDDWDDFGDDFERPFGEGSSSSSSSVTTANFRLYFKGLVSVERVGGSEAILIGIGVAICDSRDNLIFQLSKPLVGNGMSRPMNEIKALIEGLETALALDLKNIMIFCDYLPIYRYAMHAWQPKQRKIAALMAKVELLRKRFTNFRLRLVSRNVIKFAFKLARDAITSQMSKPVESDHLKNLKETCVICLEETDQDKMFTIDDCLHKYCFSCMKQHVEAKLHNGMVPKCPHESCIYELNITSCEKFLTPKLIEIMKQRIREASIPVAEKVYCPYPRCSALMSKDEVSDFAKKKNIRARMLGARECLKCHGLFCINCRVPWHKTLTCGEYKRSNPYQIEDAKLKSLATRNLWRQCVKCNHMIELAQGCYHMTCRCGYEFCYTCGAEWKNKKATCSCPLWNERNILFDDSDFDDDEDEDDFDEDDYYSDSDSEWE
ncbi:E3 ubiquitin-protein ligase RSL1 [Beta vulgaris subsp. vulgaris]|uniref:E3 ubiquitin-protein ligase RSL1 n=1 Tax=Beta vulgaris subsp. vulgaris TaxID=3555 RepID=UPI002036A69E|nr:E3 ubiquitin-protein ligase RSL1 [Beta vulgaris subsp. vulgaris]